MYYVVIIDSFVNCSDISWALMWRSAAAALAPMA